MEVGGGWTLTTLQLEGDPSLPVVHGFIGGGCREGTVLAVSGDGLTASRDRAGTRPLYVGKSGDWLATDHRFFVGREVTAMPPGATFSAGTGSAEAEHRPCGVPSDFGAEAERLGKAIELSVRARAGGKKTVAVAFSGGLDSSLLAFCAKRHSRVVACSVFTPGSRDERTAGAAAEALGVDLCAERVDAVEVERVAAGLDLPFAPSTMDKALWCIYSVASKAAAREGAETILLGQMADELFGGYMKYSRDEEKASAMMEEDVRGLGARGFVRDEAACSQWIEPRFPYADDSVLAIGLSAPASYKIRGGERKALLREAARVLGLPDELVDAPKKAAQYSSGVLRTLSRPTVF